METHASFSDQLADAARSMQGLASTQLTLEKVVLVATEIIQGATSSGSRSSTRTGSTPRSAATRR